jgi:hypothetical protein
MMTLCITALLVAFSNAQNPCLLYKTLIKDPSNLNAREKIGLCKQFKAVPQDQRQQLAACSEMAKQLVKMIPTMCQTTDGKKTGDDKKTDDKKTDDKKTDDKKSGMTDEQKRQAIAKQWKEWLLR